MNSLNMNDLIFLNLDLMKLFYLILIVTTQVTCLEDSVVHKPTPIAEESYYQAGKMVVDMQYDSALLLLNKAFDHGYGSPMRIVTDSLFHFLIDSPDFRPRIRQLIQDFARDTMATIVRDKEPGSRISVTCKILEENSHTPMENVSVEIVQADAEGSYFDEASQFNPRLFGYLRTNQNGECTIRTIRPGSYLDAEGNAVPAHIHFTLKKDGYRLFGSEFTFEDDAIIMQKGNIDSVPVAVGSDHDTDNHYTVSLYMERI